MPPQKQKVPEKRRAGTPASTSNKPAPRGGRRRFPYSLLAAENLLERCARGINLAELYGNISLREIWASCALTVSVLRRTIEDQLTLIKKLQRQLNKANAKLAEKDRESITDVLTGFGNRRYFNVMLDNAVQSAERDGTFSVVMADIDGMKAMNDTLGHPFVDEVLKLFAVLLKQSVRQGDAVTRWAGDEFGAVLPHCSVERAGVAAEQLRTAFAVAAWRLGLSCSASLGVFSSDGSLSPAEVVRRTDWALYIAKAGKIEAGDINVSIKNPANLPCKNRVSTAVRHVDADGHEAMAFTVQPPCAVEQRDVLKAQVEKALEQFPLLWEHAAKVTTTNDFISDRIPANDAAPISVKFGRSYGIDPFPGLFQRRPGQLNTGYHLPVHR